MYTSKNDKLNVENSIIEVQDVNKQNRDAREASNGNAENTILIITTGGTLASTHSNNGLVPSLSGDDFISEINGILKNCRFTFKELCCKDSSNITPENWKELAALIYKEIENYDGIVIIHGTDTMAYSAAAISFMLQNVTIPIVFTGSQLSIQNPIADAVENIRTAVNMAGSKIPGIYIAFNRKVMLGTRASKVRTLGFDAFESINYPNIAVVNSKGLDINYHALWKTNQVIKFHNNICEKVFLLKLTPGINPDIIYTLSAMGYKGIYVEGFGIGGMPSEGRSIATAVRDVVREGVTVVVGSQCLYEESNYSVYEAGHKALDYGAMEAHDMTTEAVMTKLMWILGQTNDKKEIEAYFKRNLAGEIDESYLAL